MIPPVNIGRRQAAAASRTLLSGSPAYAAGAGGYGRKLRANASVPMRLVLVTRSQPSSPNSQSSRRTVLPLGRTHRKQGYPPVNLNG